MIIRPPGLTLSAGQIFCPWFRTICISVLAIKVYTVCQQGFPRTTLKCSGQSRSNDQHEWYVRFNAIRPELNVYTHTTQKNIIRKQLTAGERRKTDRYGTCEAVTKILRDSGDSQSAGCMLWGTTLICNFKYYATQSKVKCPLTK